MYSLYYWPGLPGRGEFIRLILEQAGVRYRDVGIEDGFDPVVKMRETTAGFAPPYLEIGEQVLAQVPAICFYLGSHHHLVPAEPLAQAKVHQVFLTVMDVVNEVHDTHHPVSVALAYEDQKEAALVRSASFLNGRLQSWLTYFERILDEDDYLDLNTLSIADLALFQLIEGINYSFPKTSEQVMPDSLIQHKIRIAKLPNIASYLTSDRRQNFNETGIFRYYPELEISIDPMPSL